MTIIGVDIGGSNIKAGLVQSDEIKHFKISPTNAKSGRDIVLTEITNLIDSLFSDRVKGIGVGFPSLVKPNGIVYSVPNIDGFENFNLREFLEKKYRVPVQIANDSDCFLLGEYYFGCAKGIKNVSCITLGTGVGGGIIYRGKHIVEKDYAVSEFGRIPFRNKTIEYYCSSKFFIRNGTTGIDAEKAAKLGNLDALNLFSKFGKNLNEALPLIFNKFKPDLLIIGGSLAKANKFYKMFIKTDVKIVFSEVKHTAILGASTLIHL